MKATRFATSALLLLGTALFSNHADAQTATTITGWNFNNNAVGVNTSPATSTGTGTASTLGMNFTSQSVNPPTTATLDTSDINVSTPLSTDPGTPNQQWRIRGGDGVASPGTATNAWSSTTPIGSQGAQFLASTIGFRNIQVSFDWSPTTQGEAKLQLQYTLNGTTFVNVPANLFTANGGTMTLTNTTSANTVMGGYLQATSSTGYMNGITANLSSIAGANNNANFGIRLVSASTGADDVSTGSATTASGPLNNTSGNWRFDEVNISSIAAAPEPGTFVLAGLGLLGVGLCSRRCKAA